MKTAVIVAAALVLAACSTTSGNSSTQATGKSFEDKEYRTGSRIPVRDPSTQQSASPVTSANPSALAPGAPKAN